ncbi:putative Na+-dependent transporter [Desulfosporosinus orientis DSM 765]|uniref:Putative Na+-dependent transporter n=1 Tax=Desulfosporosinus orientis (strain ATCC 19365 / DSM 765 / NCIMB 8382 / VKM B-1628 / Singapore I) TaxID=768706 RepID=G7WI91_DESOD|nr:bile acid:sodium symporter [Desulfosporosinus orientis]AET68539.1 putative Na+-dependent transporter [Desulfosporosinus orientis DSM 765]
MLNRFAAWNSWLGRRMFLLVIAAIGAGFITAIPKSALTSRLVVILFAYMTFISALDTSIKDFFRVLKKPWIAVWILILVHFVMPFVAWGIGIIFYPQDIYTRTGFLIQAAIPIAVTSLIWTSIVSGDMALSIVAITMDTIISPFLLPLFFSIVLGKTVQLDYISMIWELMLMVSLPSLTGMIIHDLTNNRLSKLTSSIGGFSSKIAIFLMVALNAGSIVPEIHWDLGLARLLVIIGLLVACGFILGFLGSLPLRQINPATLVTMVYTIGMRNISFGVVLAMAYFPVKVAVPVTLATFFQHPIAGIVAQLFKKHGKIDSIA